MKQLENTINSLQIAQITLITSIIFIIVMGNIFIYPSLSTTATLLLYGAALCFILQIFIEKTRNKMLRLQLRMATTEYEEEDDDMV